MIIWPRKFKLIFKTIAGVVACVFCLEQISWSGDLINSALENQYNEGTQTYGSDYIKNQPVLDQNSQALSEDLITTMADAGCVLIGYGIESGSQKMLDLIKKKVTVKQAKDAIILTKKYLGWADCSLMIGYPGETKDTIRETIDFCKELDLAPEVIFFLTPYPGTELYSIALKQGKIKDEENYMLGLGEQGEKIRVNFTDFNDNELYKIQENMIKELKAWNKVKHKL